MLCFIDFHLFQDGMRLFVACRQFMQVTFKVIDNLVLGLRKKSQTPPVSHQARGRTHCEGAGIPDRVEQTGVAAQFFDTLPAPGQVVILFNCSLLHLLARFVPMSGQRLPLVERLGAHFAGMVYPHQTDTFGPVGCREFIFHNRFCRVLPARANGLAKYRPQCLVGM